MSPVFPQHFWSIIVTLKPDTRVDPETGLFVSLSSSLSLPPSLLRFAFAPSRWSLRCLALRRECCNRQTCRRSLFWLTPSPTLRDRPLLLFAASVAFLWQAQRAGQSTPGTTRHTFSPVINRSNTPIVVFARLNQRPLLRHAESVVRTLTIRWRPSWSSFDWKH